MLICQLSCSHNIAVKSLNSTRQDEVRIINGCKNIHEKIEVKRLVTFFAGCCARMVWHHQKFLFHACVMGKLVIWKKIHKKGVSFKDMMSVQGIFEGEFTLLIKREGKNVCKQKTSRPWNWYSLHSEKWTGKPLFCNLLTTYTYRS